MVSNTKKRCTVCVKELVLGYFNEEKDCRMCADCAFENDNHMYCKRDGERNMTYASREEIDESITSLIEQYHDTFRVLAD